MYILNDILNKSEINKDDFSRRAIVIGLIVQELSINPGYQNRRISSTIDLINRGLNCNQVELFFDHTGKMIGYIFWACISDLIENDMLLNPQFVPKETEITSGNNLWILDFYALSGQVKKILKLLPERVFHNVKQVTYFRIKNKKRIVKRIKITRN